MLMFMLYRTYHQIDKLQMTLKLEDLLKCSGHTGGPVLVQIRLRLRPLRYVVNQQSAKLSICASLISGTLSPRPRR